MASSEKHVCYLTNPHNNVFDQDRWNEKKEIKITLKDEPLIHLYDHRQSYKRKITLTVAEYLDLLSRCKSVRLHDSSSSRGKRIDISANVHLWLPGRGSHVTITNENVQRSPGVYLPFEKYCRLVKKQTVVILPQEYCQLFVLSLPLIFTQIGAHNYDIGLFNTTIDLVELFETRCYVGRHSEDTTIEQYLNSLPECLQQHALEYRQ